MRAARCILLVIGAAAVLGGCEPYRGSCTWVVPEAGKDVRVTEPRKAVAGECDCINCSAPGRFVLEREGYTVEFWNGDRWSPLLMVRARAKDGKVLTLKSPTPGFVENPPHVPLSATHGFEYFMRAELDDGERFVETLELHVLAPDGHEIGVEHIRLRTERRVDWSIESI